jgi:hypothetical protein
VGAGLSLAGFVQNSGLTVCVCMRACVRACSACCARVRTASDHHASTTRRYMRGNESAATRCYLMAFGGPRSAAMRASCARASLRTFEAVSWCPDHDSMAKRPRHHVPEYRNRPFVRGQVATPFESNGIDWSIVVGQNTTCAAGQIWDLSECKTCASGKAPDPSKRQCHDCPVGYAGIEGTCNQCASGTEPNPQKALCVVCATNTYSNYDTDSADSTNGRCRPCRNLEDEEPDRNQTQCVCKPGNENFGRLLRFHPKMQAQANTCIGCDTSIFPLNNVVCPGGPKVDQHIHPKPGWWMANLESQQEELTLIKSKHSVMEDDNQRSLSETLYPCDASRCLGVACRANMTGMLCATCVNPDDIKYNGICVPECASKEVQYWVLLFARYLALALLLRWKSGDLDAQIDGAVISHLTFFGQTLFLLGQFGDGGMFGFRSLFLGGSSSSTDAPSCHWTLSMYGEFYVTVFVVPAFQAVVLVCIVMLEQGKIQPIPDTIRGSARNSTPGALERTSSGTLSKAKNTNFGKKLKHKLVGATKLDFFQNANQHRTQDAKLSPAGMWWLICVNALESKLQAKGLHRTLLEVLMFSYMGITKVTFSMLICRSVENDGQTHSLSVVDSSESCHSAKFMVTRLIAAIVFVLYSGGFPLVILMRNRPDKIGNITRSLKRKVLKKCGTGGDIIEHVAATLESTAVTSAGGFVAMMDGASGGMASDFGLEISDRKKKCCERLLGDGRLRPAKFDTWCRVTNIFNTDNKGWMAMLLWRRALLVFCYTASSASGGKLYLPSGLGVDYRLLPFVLILVYVILQAHSKPFGLESDNTLEQCVLMALLLVIFADIGLDKPIFEESDHALKLKTPIVAIAVIAVLSMIVMHKRARKEGATLARVGMR